MHVVTEETTDGIEAPEEAFRYPALERQPLPEGLIPRRILCQIAPDLEGFKLDSNLAAPRLAAREMPCIGLRKPIIPGAVRHQIPVRVHRLPFALEGDIKRVLVVHLSMDRGPARPFQEAFHAHRIHVEDHHAGIEVWRARLHPEGSAI